MLLTILVSISLVINVLLIAAVSSLAVALVLSPKRKEEAYAGKLKEAEALLQSIHKEIDCVVNEKQSLLKQSEQLRTLDDKIKKEIEKLNNRVLSLELNKR